MLTLLPFQAGKGWGVFPFWRTHPNLGLKCIALPGQITQHMTIFRFWEYPSFGQILIQLNQSLYKDHNITSKTMGGAMVALNTALSSQAINDLGNYTPLSWVRSVTQSVCLAEPKFYSLLLNKSDDSRHTPSLFRGNFGLVKRRLC